MSDRLRTLFSESPTIVFALHRVEGCLVASEVTENVERLIGYTPAEVMTPGWWEDGLHPEDRARAIVGVASLDTCDELTQEYRFLRKDASVLWIHETARVVSREGGHITEVAGAWNDITARRAAEDALRESEARLRLALAASRQALVEIDLQARRLDVSEEYEAMLGYGPGELDETLEAALARLHPEDRAVAEAVLADTLAGNTDEYHLELRHRTRDGAWKWFLSVGRVAARDADGRPLRMIGTHTDISARKEMARRSQRLTQLYAALTQCNEAIVRCRNEAELFPRICRAAVTLGGMAMAWIGQLDEATGAIHPVSAYGDGLTYLVGTEATADARSPFGQGPTGTCVRENRPYWNPDYLGNPALAPWHERGRRYGWRASAALPLTREGRPFGALTLYAYTAEAFDEESRKLLIEMAADISFALDGFAREARRHEMEAKLVESEARHRTLFTESSLPMLLFDPATAVIEDANHAACRFYGESSEALRGRSIRALDVDGGDPTPPVWTPGVALPPGHPARPRPMLARHWHSDGRIRDVEIFCGDVTLGGRPLRLWSLVDVTARRRAEAALREKEQLLSESQRIAHIGSWSLDEDGRANWSDEMFRLFGYDPAEGLPSFPQTLSRLHPDDAQALQRLAGADWQHAAATDVTFRVVLPDGTLRYLSGRGERRMGPDGRAYVCGTMQDVTAQHLAEFARAESELRYRALVEQAPVAIYVNLGNRLVLANAACVRLFGADSVEALLGRSPFDLHHPDFHGVMRERIERLQVSGTTVPIIEQRIVRLDGTPVEVETTAASFQLQGETAIHVVLMDVSARRRAEEAMRVKDWAIESSINAVGIADLDGRLTYVNPAFLQLWEYERVDDVLGRPIAEFSATPTPTDEDVVDLSVTGHWSGERRVRTARGRAIDVLISAGLVLDADGRPVCMLANFADITERLRAEARVRASLHEKEGLLREIHHRVKNNLQVVTSLLRLEAGRTTEAAVRDVLREMQSRVLSMALLHETLYRTDNFARVELSQYLADVARQVLRSLAPTPGHISLRLDMAPAWVELEQAIPCGLFLNELVSNAIKHGFPGGRPGEIRVSLRPDADASRLCLVVEDDGTELPPDFEERRERSLGLRLVTDLAQQLGGTLAVGPARRPRFAVSFPPKTILGPTV